MSEMAETCSENIEGARQVLPRWSQDDIIGMMMKYKDAAYPLNTNNDAPVTPELIKLTKWHFLRTWKVRQYIVPNRNAFQVLKNINPE